MRKRVSPEERIERTHWEALVRAIINQIGPDALADVIDYVVAELRDEEMKLRQFMVERRSAGH